MARTAATFSERCLDVCGEWHRMGAGVAEEVLLGIALAAGLSPEDAKHLLCEYQSAHGERTTLAFEPATTTTVPTVGAEE